LNSSQMQVLLLDLLCREINLFPKGKEDDQERMVKE